MPAAFTAGRGLEIDARVLESVLLRPTAPSDCRGRRRRCPSSEGDTLAMQAERPGGAYGCKSFHSHIFGRRQEPARTAHGPRRTRGRTRAQAGHPCRGAAGRRPLTGRAWERSVWREARVLIAECPAPHLPASMESALRAVAASVARDRGWQGMGTVAFSLDDRSGVFRVLCAQATPCRARRWPIANLSPRMRSNCASTVAGTAMRRAHACWCG